MRRDFRKQRKIETSVILGIVCAILVLLAIVVYAIKNYSSLESDSNSNEELSILENADIADVSTEYGKTIEESESENLNNETTSDSEENKTNKTNTNSKKITTSKVQEENKVEEINVKENKIEENIAKENKEENKKDVTFCAPVKGEILRGFAQDSLVFSETLQEWITHNGVDIKADKMTVVATAAAGKVYAIKNDPRYGLTVIIEHNDGFKTVYSNLLTAEFVVEGETVEEGQTIGTIGTTAAFEISDDYHLHFELLKDNNYVDPAIYMNFE